LWQADGPLPKKPRITVRLLPGAGLLASQQAPAGDNFNLEKQQLS
jgi:hypothetical protein